MWALGCIFAELILRQPLFPGSTELEQCSKIFNILGTPEVSDWPGCDLLPTYVQFETRTPLDLTPLFG
jgi:serine/threonine protein kinase